MFSSAPPIARLSHRVLADVENAVRRFSRFHKYQIGADLRAYSMQVARCVHKAWRDSDQRATRVSELCSAVDDLKISMQLGKAVKAFGSFAEFEALAKLVNELGQQSGGWLKSLQSKGQDAAVRGSAQRAQTLPDICMCTGVDCAVADRCYRPPLRPDGSCGHFWPNDSHVDAGGDVPR